MLFDEPTSALDPELVSDVLDVMRSLADDGMTMVVVTHEMGFATGGGRQPRVHGWGRHSRVRSPKEVLSSPRQERTQLFLSRILEPWSVQPCVAGDPPCGDVARRQVPDT